MSPKIRLPETPDEYLSLLTNLQADAEKVQIPEGQRPVRGDPTKFRIINKAANALLDTKTGGIIDVPDEIATYLECYGAKRIP